MAADLKTTLFLLSTEFRSAQENLREHVTVLSSGIDALLSDKLSDEERQTLTKHLPSIVSSLVSSDKVTHDRALFVTVNKLFLKIVAVVLRFMPETPEIVGLLFDMCRVERFFDVSRVRDLEQEQLDDVSGEFARVEGEDKMRISVFAAKIVNTFGEGHGFDMLGNLLESSTNVVLMKATFRLMTAFARPMRKKVLSGFLKAYMDSSFKRLLDLRSEQLKAVSREDIGEIVNCLEPLIRFLEWENGERLTEEFCLTFSLKSFQSEMIEKRRSGLEYIDETVQVNLLRFNGDDDRAYDPWAMMGQRQPRTARWLTKSWLLNWLIDNRILDGIFDEKNTKEPLIKKSRHVLQFLGMEDKLNPEHIDAIWNCALDKYFQDATYEVIILSLRHWRERAIKQLWSKIEKLPKAAYNVDFLEFCFRVLREVNAGRNKGAVDPNSVLNLFWQAMQDDSGASIEVMRLSLDKAIATITEFGGVAARKLDFYPAFAKNIRTDKSVSQTIRCLDQVIELLHHSANKIDPREASQIQYSTRTELVHALESNYNIVTTIVHELVRYKAAVVPALLQEIALDGGQTAIMKVLHPVGKLFIHQKCLEYRLDFLFRILHRLGPRNAFDEKAADIVFSQLFYSDNASLPIIHSEREMCFNFIRIVIFQALDRTGEPGMTGQVAKHIFDDWFCNPQRNDYATMSVSDFFNFKTFFSYINLEQLKIIQAEQNYRRLIFATRSVDLYGINEIWQVLTRTDSDDVFDEVSGTLIMIYSRFTTRVRDKVDEITKLFLLTLTTLLQKSILNLTTDPLNDRQARLVNRLVKMLRKFLTQKSPEMIQDERLAAVVEDPYAITPAPSTPNEAAALKQVVEFTGVTDMVAILCLQSCRWSIEHAISSLFDEDRRSQIEREADKYSAAAKSKPKSESAQTSITPPKELLVNDQGHFDTLLNLLRLPVIDRNAVWEIVESLPPNRNIEMALRSLTEVKFSELLDPNSVYRMLYTLRIIDSLMQPKEADAPAERVEECKAWCRKFYHAGGFAYVYRLVQTMGHFAYAQSVAQKSCVVLLLKIVHHFMKGSLKDLAFSPVKKAEKGAPNPLALSQGTAQSLVDQMDFAGFLNVLVNILWNIIKESEPKDLGGSTTVGQRSDNLELVNHAMYLMASIIASRPALLVELYNTKVVDFNHFLSQSVLGIKSKELRERFSIGWQQLCAEVVSSSVEIESPSAKVLRVLLAAVPFGREPSFDADDYFDLLSKLFNAHFEQAAAIVDITEFANKLITEIHAREGDKAESESHRDHLLAGALDVLSAIVKYRPDIKERIAESLLSDLFNLTVVKAEGAFSAKCLSARTRTASFDLMKALVRGSTHTHDTALKLIAPIAKSLQDQKKESGTARRDNFVGFLNPRHISCYANSLVQQFYMIPEFRKSLFDVASTHSPRESALSEIQRLFGFLQLSERHHIDPSQLIQHFAKKMNINQQNDASEFFSHVTERLEEELAPTTHKTLLDDLFKLTLNREIICGVNKEHVSTGIEENQLLGVEIFKTTNLNQALKNLFEGDKIDSYRCDTCKSSVEARRVWSIKTLPPILVVHIKRFAMDFNTMLLEKVTSLFEYPFELDLKEFRSRSSDLTPEQCIYDLVGVVVHSGVKLEAGHYYSFIKERGGDPDEARWWRFDDTTVTEFDVDTLGEETFGGEHTWLPREERENWQNKNAYMLFYEQRHRPNAITDEGSEVSEARVPPTLANAIVSDNTQLLRERLSGDRFTLDFVKAILETFTFKPIKTLEVLDEASPVFIAIEMMTSLLLDGKVDKNNVQAYDAWVNALIRHFQNHIPACRWFLATLMTTKAKVFSQLLLDSQDLHVRLAFKRLVLAVLQALYAAEAPNFPANIDANVEEIRDAKGKAVGPSHQIPPPASIQPLIASFASVAFADYLICMMEEVRPRWQRFHQFWDLLLGVVNLGQSMRQYLAARRLLFWLADFYMGPFSGRWKSVHPNHERVRLGIQGEMHLLLLQEFFEVMTAMVSASHTRATVRLAQQAKEAGGSTFALPATSRYGELIARDEAAEELLLRVDVLASLIKQAYSVHSNITLCQHLSWEDEERSALVLSVLMTSVKRGSSDRMPVILPVIEELLSAPDSLKYYRPAVAMSTVGVGLFAVLRDLLDGVRHIDRMHLIESILSFAYSAAQKNPRIARALRIKAADIKTVVNEVCSVLIKEVEDDIERLERTDDQLKLARLSESSMRWNAFLSGESDMKEEAFPEGFDLAKFAVTSLQSRDDD